MYNVYICQNPIISNPIISKYIEIQLFVSIFPLEKLEEIPLHKQKKNSKYVSYTYINYILKYNLK